MKRILLILLLMLPLMAGAQTYSELQTRINANVWRDGTRFQTNTYRRFYSDTLNALLQDIITWNKDGFLPLTLTGDATVSGVYDLSFGDFITDEQLKEYRLYAEDIYVASIAPNAYAQYDVRDFDNPTGLTYTTIVQGSKSLIFLHYKDLDAGQYSTEMQIGSDTDSTFNGITIRTTGDGTPKAELKFGGDYTSAMTTDRHIPDIGKVKSLILDELYARSLI